MARSKRHMMPMTRAAACLPSWPAHRAIWWSGTILRLFLRCALFRIAVFPCGRPDQPVAERGCDFCGRLPHASYRRLAFWPHCRPARPAHIHADFGHDDVPWLFRHRHSADLSEHRHSGAVTAADRAAFAGTFRRWRIRHHRNLYERGGAGRSPRLLLLVPVCHVDRRAVAGRSGYRGAAVLPDIG